MSAAADKKKLEDEMEIEDEEEVEEQPEDETFDIAQPKYRSAAQVVNDVIAKVIAECQPGKKVVDICEFGDNLINQKVKNLYKKAAKGIAFPTCISVNNIVCHYSPMDGDALALKANDVVHIDCGVHCDGYIATAATTIVLSEQPLTGKAADAMAAAEKCVDAAMRLMKPGHTNTEVTQVIQKVCNEYGVNAAEGVLSHQLKRFVIDGRNVIIGKPTPQQQVDEFKFGENEVYALDIVISTGQGKLRETEFKPTIYKRNPEQTVMLKRKSSKQTLSELAKYEGFPFTARALDKKTGRMGIIELFRTGLVDPYPVLCEKNNEFVAHIKTTIFISTAQVSKATVTPVAKYQSAKAIQDKELNELLASSLKIKDKKKGAAPAAAPAKGADAMEE